MMLKLLKRKNNQLMSFCIDDAEDLKNIKLNGLPAYDDLYWFFPCLWEQILATHTFWHLNCKNDHLFDSDEN